MKAGASLKRAGWPVLILSLALLYIARDRQNKPGKTNENMITWKQLPDLPGAPGTPGLGVSAPFAGSHDGTILVAGGCNFPDKPITEGGTKRYYDEIFALLPEGWTIVGHLPEPVAYGASVSTPEGIVCVGGNNAERSLTTVTRLRLDTASRTAKAEPLPSLPRPMDNLAAARLGDYLYVVGGNADKRPSHLFLRLSLTCPEEGWQPLPDYPGPARVQPTLAAARTPEGARLFLAGGFQPPIDGEDPQLPTELLAFDPATGRWEVEGALPPFADGSSRSLTGGCAVSYQTDKILYMGGVNYDCFLDALSRPLRIARAEASGDTATAARLREEEKAYMLRPVEWYRFNTTLLRYDVSAKSWSELGDFEPLARAGAGAVMEGDRLTIVNGELKPGVRSPRVSQAILKE